MNKLKHNVDRDFTIAPNIIFKDNRLSLKAKGLWLQILSLPENWEFSVKGLSKLAKDNETSISTAIKELIDGKYLKWERKNGADGCGGFYVEVTTCLPESTQAKITYVENTYVKNTYVENSHNKEYNNKELNIINNINNNTSQIGKQTDKTIEEIKILHSEICKIFNKQESRYKLSDKRKLKLKSRLKDCGYDNILKACTAISNSKWHMGQNDRHWVADPYWCLDSYDKAESWFNKQIDRDNIKKQYIKEDIAKSKLPEKQNFNPDSEAFKKYKEARNKLFKGK